MSVKAPSRKLHALNLIRVRASFHMFTDYLHVDTLVSRRGSLDALEDSAFERGKMRIVRVLGLLSLPSFRLIRRGTIR
jgi:hypothetical protein